MAATAEELDCAVLLQRLPERPGTMFSLDAIFTVGLALQAKSFANAKKKKKNNNNNNNDDDDDDDDNAHECHHQHTRPTRS